MTPRLHDFLRRVVKKHNVKFIVADVEKAKAYVPEDLEKHIHAQTDLPRDKVLITWFDGNDGTPQMKGVIEMIEAHTGKKFDYGTGPV